MNGGLLDAVESSPARAIDAAVSGYLFLGLHVAATIVEEIYSRLDEAQQSQEAAEGLESEATQRYGQAIPSDTTIVKAFEARYEEQPDLFAPLGVVRPAYGNASVGYLE